MIVFDAPLVVTAHQLKSHKQHIVHNHSICNYYMLFLLNLYQVSVVAGAAGKADGGPFPYMHPANVPLDASGIRGIAISGSLFVDIVNSTLVGRYVNGL